MSALSALRWIWVSAASGASFTLYFALLVLIPRLAPAQSSFADELFPAIAGLEQRFPLEWVDRLEIRFLALLLVLFGIYGLTIRATAGNRSRRLECAVFIGGAAFLIVQTLGPVLLSSDVYSYAMYGRIFALYGGNPHLDLPSQYPGDPFFPLVYWKDTPSYYGPLWTLVAGVITRLAGDNIGLTVFLFRVLAITAALFAAGFLWHCLRRFAPDRAAQGLVFFLWNPLVIIETGLSAHNDTVMVVFLLLSIAAHLRGRHAIAVIALTVSALVKFATGALIPLYLLLLLRQLNGWPRRLRVITSGSVGSLLAIAVVLYFAHVGPETLTLSGLGTGVERYANNVHELIFAALRLRVTGAPPEDAELKPFHIQLPFAVKSMNLPGELKVPLYYKGKDGPITGPVGERVNGWLRATTWVAFVGIWLMAAWRVRNFRSYVVASLVCLLSIYWLLAAWIWPWYVIWAIALGAFVPTRWPARAAAVLSATVLTLYVGSGYEGSEEWWFYAYRSIPAFVLPLVVVLLAFGASRMSSSLREAYASLRGQTPAWSERLSPQFKQARNQEPVEERAAA